MQPLISSADREEALRLLYSLIDAAATATNTTMLIRLTAWIEARDDDEGGFLWLAGQLGFRPTHLASIIYTTMGAPKRRRQAIDRVMSTIFWNALNG